MLHSAAKQPSASASPPQKEEDNGPALKDIFKELRIPNDQFVRVAHVLREPALPVKSLASLLKSLDKLKEHAKHHKDSRGRLKQLKTALLNVVYLTGSTYYTNLVKYYAPDYFNRNFSQMKDVFNEKLAEAKKEPAKSEETSSSKDQKKEAEKSPLLPEILNLVCV